jgi:hypothetical protein
MPSQRTAAVAAGKRECRKRECRKRECRKQECASGSATSGSAASGSADSLRGSGGGGCYALRCVRHFEATRTRLAAVRVI